MQLSLFYLASEVAETQNPLAICHHNDLNTLLRPVSQQVQNLTPGKTIMPKEFIYVHVQIKE